MAHIVAAREVRMIKTKGILHVTIPVSDPARSRAFYTDILGLEFVAQVPKENPHFVFLKSGADYVLLGRDPSCERFSDLIHHAFMVDGDAYDAAVAELRAKGGDGFREEQRDEGIFTGRSAYFPDPDNNALEVIPLPNRAKGCDDAQTRAHPRLRRLRDRARLEGRQRTPGGDRPHGADRYGSVAAALAVSARPRVRSRRGVGLGLRGGAGSRSSVPRDSGFSPSPLPSWL